MSNPEEWEKNQAIVSFLESNPGIHTKVKDFLARNISSTLFIVKWNLIKLILFISTIKPNPRMRN